MDSKALGLCGVAAFVTAVILFKQHGGTAKMLAAKAPESTPTSNVYEACQKGFADEVQKHIAAGADVNAKNPTDNNTPLEVATSYKTFGQSEVVKLLIEKGANVNGKGAYDRTALHVAAGNGRLDLVAYLLKHGADPNATDRAGATPLSRLAENAEDEGDFKVAELLLKHGAALDAMNNDGRTALRQAIEHNKPKMAAWLLKQGASESGSDAYGESVLQAAAWDGNLETVNELLGNGADVNRPGREGNTALHAAAHKGHLKIVETLLAKGANANAKNAIGYTPLHEAARENRLEIATLLVKSGANVNAAAKMAVTPLRLARGNEMIRFLKEKGAK